MVFIFQDRAINKKKNTTRKVLVALSALMHFSSSPCFKPTLGSHFAVPRISTYVESIRAPGRPRFRRSKRRAIHFNAVNRTQLPRLLTITGFSRGFFVICSPGWQGSNGQTEQHSSLGFFPLWLPGFGNLFA